MNELMREQRDAFRGAFAINAAAEIDMTAAGDAAEAARQVPGDMSQVQHDPFQIDARDVRCQRSDFRGAKWPDGRGNMADDHAN